MKNYGAVHLARCCCAIVVLVGCELHILQGRAAEIDEGVTPIPVEGRFSWPIRLADGRLMSVHNEGKKFEKVITDTETIEKAIARYSTDDGATWSEPEVLFEFPKSGGKYMQNTILRDKDNNLHLFGLHFFAQYSDWISPVYQVMSTDGGKTWTPPQDVPFGHAYCGCMNSVIQLRNGRIVLPIGYFGGGSHGWFSNTMSLSDDGGKTWQPSSEEPSLDKISIDEAVGVQLKDGRLWLLFRTGAGYLYESISPDGDKWPKATPTRFVSPSAPAGAVRLKDSRILIAWNNSLKPRHVMNRLVIAAAISDDEGQTWKGYREIARADRNPGHGHGPSYPWLIEAGDGSVLVSFFLMHGHEGEKFVLRLNPDWLEEAEFHDDFSDGIGNWITKNTTGPEVVDHPDEPAGKVLRLHKPEMDQPSGASLNFPFGVQGGLTMRLQLRPGSFHGARICLTDHFTWPSYVEDGRFGFTIGPDGEIGFDQGEDHPHAIGVKLESGKWHTMRLEWDCEAGICQLTLDGEHVAELPQLSLAVGICYLRLVCLAEDIDLAGLDIDWVEATVTP